MNRPGNTARSKAEHLAPAWYCIRRLWLGVALFGVLFGTLQARAQGPAGIQDILQKTEQYYRDIHAFSAKFKQLTSSATAAAMASEASGRFYYLRPEMMRWEYETPETQIFIVHGDLAWLHVPQERQITLFGKEQLFSSPFIRTLFEGVVELRKHFEVRLDNHSSDTATVVLALTPKKEDPNVQSLRLWVDRSEGHIVAIQSRDALGNTNRLDFSLQRKIPKLPKALFLLEVPVATAVIGQDGRRLTPTEIHAIQKQQSKTR